jgi:type II secretory pathway pseudopilin PulG
MIKTLLKFLLNTQLKLNRAKSAQTVSGFTMIELLIGTIIAFLIIGPLLGFVVTILNDDTREQTKSAGEFELQAAIDYMSEDISQAYYIYTLKQLEQIAVNPPNGGEPLLIFWKLKRLPDAVPPADKIDQINPSNCTPDTCDDANVRALVAYYLVQDNNPIWCQPESNADNCPQRIVRYEFNDGLKKPGGLYYEVGEADDSQLKDDQYNENFDQGLLFKDDEDSRDAATQNLIIGNLTNGEVLINYVDIDNDDDDNRFRIPLDPDNPEREPLQRVKFQIRLNSLRRIDAKNEGCDDEGSAYCPKASIEIEGLQIQN